jgi:hypothetical protein
VEEYKRNKIYKNGNVFNRTKKNDICILTFDCPKCVKKYEEVSFLKEIFMKKVHFFLLFFKAK